MEKYFEIVNNEKKKTGGQKFYIFIPLHWSDSWGIINTYKTDIYMSLE